MADSITVRKAYTTQYCSPSQYVASCPLTPYASTYREPLCVIGLAAAEKGLQGVVGRNGETGGVDQELAGNVKEDEEEVEGADAEDYVDLGDGGLLFERVELGVLGELPIAGRQSW